MENGFSTHEGQAGDVTAAEPPTYEEAFPPLGSPTLPTGPAPSFPASASYGRGTQSAWPVKSIPSSSVTQVRCNACGLHPMCAHLQRYWISPRGSA